ncbi:NAD(P)/FAD-dependent oxidoreductase [Arthrobacter sp. ISL-69]|uniref:FAD/NAD(P)-dependent oxidoreductase n=1 Tax=Arthrobacter sp. ISL-69 TaxID=2819113 RepID=UPI001BE6C97E|nr:FAD-dependent oxidoreductase [Arthrobacter sp. ISL-69]MBT2534907.1 FAD-dependent oxidoreductase [Arthrobacter sp. ISL-69]
MTSTSTVRTVSADVAVLGAGPAGLAAAVAAAEAGADVVVVDAGAQPGGQFWRHRPEAVVPTPDGKGHHGWKSYLDLRARFDAARRRGRITYLPGLQAWMAEKVDAGFILRTTPTVAGGSHSGKADGGSTVVARRLVLCPGGYDRQLPVPGWDLPGVMAAGGIQAFIKANGILPGRRFVIAGTGPFLLPVAANIAEAGGEVLAVLESSSPTAWLPHLRAAAGVPEKALEGAEYAAVFARHRIPYRTRSIVTEVLGTDHVSGVRTGKVDADGRVRPGTERVYEDVDVVGFGWGFTPQMELPLSFGIQARLDADGSLVGVVDERQQSSVPGLFLAGEVTGVGGATLAVLEGLAAGTAAAGGTVLPEKTAARHRRFAEAMHRAHPVPPAWQDWLAPETIVCRCEEVTARQITDARESLAARDSRTLKSFTRAGMGWCQGRVCGFAAACIGAGPGAAPTAESLSGSAKRPLAAPVGIGELASLETTDN